MEKTKIDTKNVLNFVLYSFASFDIFLCVLNEFIFEILRDIRRYIVNLLVFYSFINFRGPFVHSQHISTQIYCSTSTLFDEVLRGIDTYRYLDSWKCREEKLLAKGYAHNIATYPSNMYMAKIIFYIYSDNKNMWFTNLGKVKPCV
jgi:hypothetical protein